MRLLGRSNFVTRLFVLLLFFCGMLVNSGASNTPKYSNEFLSIGVGARALGMSNAQISSVNDVTSGYWNPAGLLGVKSDIQAMAMHSEYFAGIAKYDYLGLAIPTDSNSALGISFIRFGVDDIPNTTQLIDAEGNINYDRITSFSAADNAFLISYARKVSVIQVGVNAKIIHRKVGDFAQSWGFGIDVGARYAYRGWQFSAVARDLTSTFNAWSFSLSEEIQEVFILTDNELPENGMELTLPRLLLGASKRFEVGQHFSVEPALDLEATVDGRRNVLINTAPISFDPRLGFELAYKNLAFLRGGIGNLQREQADAGTRELITFQPNMGLGIRLKNLTIDWALTDVADQSVALNSHIFSLKLDIHKRQ